MTEFNCAIEGKTGLRREPYYVADKLSMSLEHFYIPEHYQDTLDGLLIPAGAIADRIEKLAYDITQDYNGVTIHLICVLKGEWLLVAPIRENPLYFVTFTQGAPPFLGSYAMQ
jgi:hypothetical protein